MNLAHAILHAPLALMPGAERQLERYAAAIAGSVELSAADLRAAAAFDTSGRAPVRHSIAGGVAVVQIAGALYHAPEGDDEWASYFGMMSYQAIAAQLRSLSSRPDVRAIVLDVDSPGGTNAGLLELADVVAELSTRIPIVAIARDLACSAAAWVTSAADVMFATPMAVLGSIGVRVCYYDFTQNFATDGIKVVPITTGVHKAMGVAGVPITPEQVASVQALIDDAYSLFVAAMVEGRGMDEAVVRGLQAACVSPQKALEVGLIDRIGSLEDAIAEAQRLGGIPKSPSSSARAGRVAPAAAGAMTESHMDYSVLTAADIRKHRPDLAAQLNEQAKPAPATIAELQSAFAGNNDFIVACLSKTLTLGEAREADLSARAAAAGALKTQVETLTTEKAALTAKVADLEKQLAARPAVSGADPLKFAANPEATKNDFASLVVAERDRIMAANPATKRAMAHAEAVVNVAHKHPAAHAEWKKAGCPNINAA